MRFKIELSLTLCYDESRMLGIFDSGMGGLTVAAAIARISPAVDFVYFGDLANMPFGAKSESELLEITKHAIKFLTDHGATEIVAACNSVSMYVHELRLQNEFSMNEMSEPTTRALSLCKSGSVLVCATEATVRSKLYEHAFAEKGIEVMSMAIPELASMIERNATMEELKSIIRPVVDYAILMNAKTLVLGCTQYPFAKSIFEKLFQSQNYEIEIFDPAEAVADEVIKRFDQKGTGIQKFFLSKDSMVFRDTVEKLFSCEVIVIK